MFRKLFCWCIQPKNIEKEVFPNEPEVIPIPIPMQSRGFANLELDLLQMNKDNTPWFTLKGQIKKCKCIDVYDADTITVIVDIGKKFYKKKCRLLGVDAAEKRTKNLEEKEHALKGQKRVSSLILDQIIWVECGDWDKYGRLLGTIYLNEDDVGTENNLNNTLIKEKLAYKYDGKKKQKFDEWFKV